MGESRYKYMKVSIYRVETPRGGAGPYDKALWDELEAMFCEHGSGTHPGPADDPLLRGISDNEYCGFATLADLDEWFDGFHDALHKLGFLVAKYVVPAHIVRYGTKQAVFRRGDHFPVESMPIR